MGRKTVAWKWVVAVLSVLLLAAVAIGVLRADGFRSVAATSPHSTRWFPDPSSGRVVLVDGYSGRALARLQPGDDTQIDEVVQGGGLATALDRTSRLSRSIDGADLKLGPGQPLPILGDPGTVVGMSEAGLIVVDPVADEARVVPPGGTAVTVDVAAESSPTRTRIAPDGGIWTLNGGELRRTTTADSDVVASELQTASFTLVGDQPLVLDRTQRRVRYGEADWVALPDDFQVDDIALQSPGPNSDCGWLGVDGELICVGADGVHRQVSVPDLDIDGGDVLAIAGDAAAVVDRSTGEIQRLSMNEGRVLQVVQTEGAVSNNLRVATGPDLVWVDSPGDATVWVVNPWGMNTVRKDDASTPIVGEEGSLVAEGASTGDGKPVGPADGEATTTEEREPDNNGVDDPPVAVDDTISARAGNIVPINVTANDYDPDGEAIALSAVGSASHGTLAVSSATTISYQPEPDYVGGDQFEYTIVDGDGTEASATVTVELLSPSANNQAPVGAPDQAETGPGRPVVLDVLLNDVDPERDALRISSFQSDNGAGRVEEVAGASGLPGLRFLPAEGFAGAATFSYSPMDIFGATGEPVTVTVEVAEPGSENRPPIVKSDAARVRRGEPTEVAVLANDSDPDGDDLTLELGESLPDAIDAVIDGNNLVITARAGAVGLATVGYRVVDSAGQVGYGEVLVTVVEDAEPNQPPIANADTANAVAGKPTVIDVLRNDTDPDNDPLTLVSVSSAEGGTTRVDKDQVIYSANPIEGGEPVLDRFTYVVTDTAGHEVEGVVSVKVIPRELPEPPVAVDDSANTERDVPVTVDVLDNDSDPSGQSLSIIGKPGCPSGGNAVVTSDGLVRFTPPEGAAGVFRCSYEIANTAGLRSAARLTVTVVAPVVANKPPLVTGEDRAVRVGQTITVDVLDNDSDPDGDDGALRLVNSSNPSSGVATRDDKAGTITYQAPTEPTVVSISYQVADGEGAISSGRLVVRVIGETGQPPVAAPDTSTVDAPAGEIVLNVLDNDSDPDGDRGGLTISDVQVLSGGGTAAVADRSVRLNIDDDFVGTFEARYQITDPDDLTAVGAITVVVVAQPKNRAPVPQADTATVVGGETVRVPIALNDSDPDGDDLTFTIQQAPPKAAGTATLDGSELVFASAKGYSGTIEIPYQVSDGESTNSATVTITVTPCVGTEPVARDGFLSTGYLQPIDIDLNDYADGGEITAVTGVIDAPTARYTPPVGENGNVNVQFAVVNACGGRAVGTLTIDVNQDPVAAPKTVELPKGGSRTILVTELASDTEALTITGLTGAPNWATVDAERRTIALAPGRASGRFNFTATVTDPGGLRADVPVTVDIKNGAPKAYDQIVVAEDAIVEIDVFSSPTANPIDPDGDPLELLTVDGEARFKNKLVPIRVDGKIMRIDLTGAEGYGYFSYSVQDDSGLGSNTASITIDPNWGAPKIAEDIDVEVDPGIEKLVSLPVTHPDAIDFEVTLSDPSPDGMQITVNNNTETPTMLIETDPEVIEPGVYEVPYQATDRGGRGATGTVNVTVNEPTTTSSSTGSSVTAKE